MPNETASIILGLIAIIIYLWVKKGRDERLSGPFAARLGMPKEPKPGGHDLGLLDELPLGEFCASRKAERMPRHDGTIGRRPRNLDAYMDGLDRKGGS